MNLLEKRGILPSAKEWVLMREFRNHLIHEYPDNLDLMADNLNKALEYVKALLALWQTLKERINHIKATYLE